MWLDAEYYQKAASGTILSFKRLHVRLRPDGEIPVNLHTLLPSPDAVSKTLTALVAAVTLYTGSRTWAEKHLLKKRLESDTFTTQDLKKLALDKSDYYVRPDCQDNSPVSTGPAKNRRALFADIDHLLSVPVPEPLILLLADTGMGKSTFFWKYYAYHWGAASRSRRFKLGMIRLRDVDVNAILSQFNQQAASETVLFLDALDEDPAAVADYSQRFADLRRLVVHFRCVVVTCRTQFYRGLPESFAPLPFKGRASLTDAGTHGPHELFLSQLSDVHVKRYLQQRFPYWRFPCMRKRAEKTVERFGDLVARPLLLYFIQDLVPTTEEATHIQYSYQIYELIVERWLLLEKEDKRAVASIEKLRSFCDQFAVHLFANGTDAIPGKELREVAEKFGAEPILREIRERSLLHCYQDQWKFAHSSIMEFLAVNALAGNCSAEVTAEARRRLHWTAVPWTAQMRKFAGEMIVAGEYQDFPGADLRGLALNGINFSHRDFTGANLSETDFEGCPFQHAILRKADLSGTDFTRVQFDGADFQGATFARTILAGANLREACGLSLAQAVLADSDRDTWWPSRVLQAAVGVGVLALYEEGQRVVFTDNGCVKSCDFSGNDLQSLWDGRKYQTSTNAITLSRNGCTATVALGSEELLRLDLTRGGEFDTLFLESPIIQPHPMALSWDGKIAIYKCRDNALAIIDVGTGHEIGQRFFAEDDFTPYKLSGERPSVICQAGSLLGFVDFERERKRVFFSTNGASFRGVEVLDDDRLVVCVSSTSSGLLSRIKLEDEQDMVVLEGHDDEVHAFAVSANRKRAASAAGKELKVWDIESRHDLLTLHEDFHAVTHVAISADGEQIVSAAADGTVRIWFPSGSAARS
jgi:hypothetical protein